jgi:hypothetical protein
MLVTMRAIAWRNKVKLVRAVFDPIQPDSTLGAVGYQMPNNPAANTATSSSETACKTMDYCAKKKHVTHSPRDCPSC